MCGANLPSARNEQEVQKRKSSGKFSDEELVTVVFEWKDFNMKWL